MQNEKQKNKMKNPQTWQLSQKFSKGWQEVYTTRDDLKIALTEYEKYTYICKVFDIVGSLM